ncbi:MAG: hypothetical protein DWQ04_06450 [Chloroflexi bacterium]|nr:MAG: hypothetical protein DWQ04_06450 [Chloroflexota bacterium]
MSMFDNSHEMQELVKKRLRQVGEPLVTNAGLRDELTDAQAQQLLDWGMARLQETAVRTARFPDDDAVAVLEKKETAVRLIMQLVNQLVAQPGLLPDEDIVNSRLIRLGKNLQWLYNSPNDRMRVRAIFEFKHQRDQLDRDTAFQLLLAILDPKQQHLIPTDDSTTS